MAELRKAPGMRERAHGVWELYIDAGRDVLTGQRRRVSHTFHGNLREAKQRRAELLAEQGRGKYSGAQATVDELCEEWLKELRRLQRSPSTIDNYARHYRHDIRPTLGKVQVTKVTTKMLTDLYAAHQDRGVAAATVYQIHAAISAMMSQACRWGWRDTNPAQWASKPPRRKKRPKAPSPAGVVELIDEAKRSRRPEYARAIFIASTTGIRRGELCAIRIRRNVNWDSAELTVTHNILELTGKPLIEKEGPKNDDDRSLAIDATTLSLMTAQLEMMQIRSAMCGASLVEDAFLFSNAADGSLPWRPGAITQYFSRLRKRAGLAQIQYKQMRTFMDTYGQDLGFSLAQVALRAGHDPAVASKYYTGRVSETDRELATELASLLVPDDTNTDPV